MVVYSVAVPLGHRRRAFFLARITQQVKIYDVGPELLRAGAALATIVAWAGALALIIG
jgi:hypothetical protein